MTVSHLIACGNSCHQCCADSKTSCDGTASAAANENTANNVFLQACASYGQHTPPPLPHEPKLNLALAWPLCLYQHTSNGRVICLGKPEGALLTV